MAIAQGGNGQLATRMQQGNLTDQKEKNFTGVITAELAKQFQAMKSIVPKHVTPERMARIGLQAISRNPKLMECSPETVVGAIMNCATLGLEPNLIGHAYLVPFWNGSTKKMEAQFQIGYKGLLDLVRRTGEVSRIYAYEVHENDEFEYELGVNAALKHKPAMKDRGAVIGYYAVYHLKDGGYGFHYMSREDVEKHAKRFTKSQKDGAIFGPWRDHFDEMAKKTVMRAMLKYMPIAVETAEKQKIMEGIGRDESVVTVNRDKTGMTDDAFFSATYTVEADEETGEIIDGATAPAGDEMKAE